eukprot:50570-Eustigmatos_ZCMA.PRE.2
MQRGKYVAPPLKTPLWRKQSTGLTYTNEYRGTDLLEDVVVGVFKLLQQGGPRVVVDVDLQHRRRTDGERPHLSRTSVSIHAD